MDGITTTTAETILASECCSLGIANNDASLLMACEDSSETTLTWNEEMMECTSTTNVVMDGVPSTTTEPILASECCSVGIDNEDAALIMACEN